MRGRAPLALVVLAAAVAGCGSKQPRPANDGILWISWTVRGQPVSDSVCKGVDHLALTMETSGGGLSIEPIPCLRGLGWEYDGLPEGNNFVIVDGYDVNGFVTLEGSSTVAVTAAKPTTPAPIDLLTTR
ncbi:MAG: hypothetical protein JWM53_1961 [bacterium]|nr:hypothetical protein [bacterium]